MRTGNNPGSPSLFVVVGASTSDYRPHGGHDLDPPPVMNKRVQVLATDHPRTDRWVSLTTIHEDLDFTYRVAVVDGFNSPTQPPKDYSTLPRARRAANRLLRKMENS